MMVLDFINQYIYVAYIIVILIILCLLIKALKMVLKCVKKLSDNANKLTNNISTLTSQTKQIAGFVNSASDAAGNTSKALLILNIVSQLYDGKKYTSKPMKKVIVDTAVKNAPKLLDLL